MTNSNPTDWIRNALMGIAVTVCGFIAKTAFDSVAANASLAREVTAIGEQNAVRDSVLKELQTEVRTVRDYMIERKGIDERLKALERDFSSSHNIRWKVPDMQEFQRLFCLKNDLQPVEVTNGH